MLIAQTLQVASHVHANKDIWEMEPRVMVSKNHQEWFQPISQGCAKKFGGLGIEINGSYLLVAL